ncbi:MAG: hypothetical protein ACHP84_13055 [Caulobacterales bacterium]
MLLKMTKPHASSRGAAVAAIAAALLCACTPTPPSGRGLDKDALDAAIGRAIGDPTTCVLLADRVSGQVVYQYGDPFNCARPMPACDTAGTMNDKDALKTAARPGGRMVSCNSVPDGSRTVGWASGRVQSQKRDLVYAAVMEGQRALPGQEMSARLDGAFSQAGL